MINQILILILGCYKTYSEKFILRIDLHLVKNIQNMKKYGFLVLVIISLLFSNKNFAQEQTLAKDTLWYLNGDKELISNYEFIEEGRILNYVNHKGKHKDVETFFLFSLNKADGSVKIIYKPSMEEEGDTLTVDEMRSFVLGGFFGTTKYKARGALVEGFVVGAASPFLVASLGANPFFSIIIPAINSTVVGVTKPSEKKIQKQYPELSKDTLFVEGYKEAAKRKRTKNSIIGGLIGMAAGIVTVFIIGG